MFDEYSAANPVIDWRSCFSQKLDMGKVWANTLVCESSSYFHKINLCANGDQHSNWWALLFLEKLPYGQIAATQSLTGA